MSNIRQRRGPSPSRDNFGHSSISWEIGNDDGGERGRTTARKVIPMYNPTNMKPSLSNTNSTLSSPHSNTVSHRVSWNTIMDAKNANSDFLREVPPAKTYLNSHGYYSGQEVEYEAFQSGRRLSSMAPALVPDSAYRAYKLGRPGQKQKESGIDKIQLAKILGYFSIVGFLFLTCVGILIDTQPMYLQGILEKNQEITSDGKTVKTFYAVSIHERLEPAKRAYRGGLLYLLTAVVCFAYTHNMYHYVFKKGWQQYRDIDDVDSTVPTFGGIDGYLPTTGTVPRKAYEGHTGFVMRTWYTTSVTVQRLGIYMASVWQARRRNRRRFAGAKDV